MAPSVFYFFMAIQTKHLLVDFIFQTPEVARNKGDLRKYHGYWHSLQHAAASFAILMILTPATLSLSIGLTIFDFVTHLFIDAGKVHLVKHGQYKCNTHNEFWWLTGLDQYLHQMVYVVMAVCVYTN